MRTWLSFFFYDAFWIWIPILLSPRLLSISRTSYFLPHSIIPISGKETEIEKEKERKKEEKKRRKFVSSPQGNYIFPLELFIGNIIYRMKRFSRPVPVFLSPSRESTEFRYRMIKYCRETFARSVRIVSGNFSTTITLRNF